MNQDSFRKLLTIPHPVSSSTSSRVGQSTKKATLNVSEPAFQPRKVTKRKINSDYRDRASERRAGVNDYAEVESVLEDFEKKTAELEDRDAVEEQRRYLGGDKDHTILVKGLDFALLEQNKARSMLSREDDDSLEAAFQEAQPKPVVPTKRTREDLIRELKERRTSGSTNPDPATQEPAANKAFEAAKLLGKFKPIGAPDSSTGHEHSKAAKGKGRDKLGVEQKKKRRKVGSRLAAVTDKHGTEMPLSQTTMPASSEAPLLPPTQASSGISAVVSNLGGRLLDPALPTVNVEEVDIFADAGEYEGVDFGEDEDDEHPADSVKAEEHMGPTSGGLATKSWFTENEPASVPGPSVVLPSILPTTAYVSAVPEEPEPEQVTRLVPLASSALPSISDFLAMDVQAEAQKKRKAKKEKMKGGEKKQKMSTDVKVDRDYKKLNSYLAKKGDGSKSI